jgi:hypothetical protein
MALLSVLAAATEEAKPSEVPFLVAGGLLAIFAVLVSFVGLRRPDFPRTAGASRGVIALGALLVAATLAASVATS